MRLYGLEGSFVIENEIINGGGAIGPLGILNADCTVEVAKEGGQAAATIVAENAVNMYARLWSPSKRRAVWLVNQDVVPQLYGLVWGTGTSVVPLFRWGADGEPLLMGRPVLEVEYCATLGTVGDIIFANWKQYKTISKGGMQTARSMHVEFLTGQEVFRFTMRTDGKPKRKSKVTPFKGTLSLSPFVTLATRA